MRDPVRWLGGLAVLLVTLAAIGLVRLGDRDDLSAQGIERLLAYRLDEPITFALEPGEREIRLLTWLVTEAADLTDDRATETYAIAVRVRDAVGAVVLDRSTWIATRPAWLPRGDHLLPERLGSGAQVWADRTTHLDVADLAPLGGTVEISPVRVPRGGSLLAVAHRRAEAGSLAMLRTLRRGDLDAGDRIAPWSMSVLPLSWQENAARVQWERLGALPPEEGGVAPTARLETTFRSLPGVSGPAAGSPVWPGGALVWLLDGLTTFTATLSADHGVTPAPGPGVVRVRRADGSESVEPVTGSAIGPISTEGPTEITFALDATATGPRWVEAITRGGPSDRAQGDPPRVVIDDERQAVAPDFRQVEAWRVLPGDPVAFPLRPGEHVKVMVRHPLGAGARPGIGEARVEPAVTLAFTALGEDGAVLGEWPISSSPVASAFERYVRGDDEGDTRVSEPLPVYVRPPEGAAALRISTADVAADVSVSVTDRPDVPGVVLPEYALPGDFPWELRYEPHVERGWRARAPVDEERLAMAGRSVAIDGQVRWIPREPPGAGTTAADKDSLDLAGPFELLAEPATVGTKGGRVSLGARPTVVRLPPSGRLEIDWRVPLVSVGRWVRIVAGGRTVMRQLHAAGGTFRVDGLGTDPVEVAVIVEGEGARRGLFLARATGDPAWQVRRVWRIAEDREVAIPIPAGASSLSVDVYRVGQAGQVRWRVEAIGPDAIGASLVSTRRSGIASDPWSDAAAALPLSFDGVPLTRLRPILVSRPEGSPAATLLLRPEGTGGRVWIRAQSTWAADRSEATRHARRPAAAP